MDKGERKSYQETLTRVDWCKHALRASVFTRMGSYFIYCFNLFLFGNDDRFTGTGRDSTGRPSFPTSHVIKRQE